MQLGNVRGKYVAAAQPKDAFSVLAARDDGIKHECLPVHRIVQTPLQALVVQCVYTIYGSMF